MIATVIATKEGLFVICTKCARKNKVDLSNYPDHDEWIIVCEYCEEPIRFSIKSAQVKAET